MTRSTPAISSKILQRDESKPNFEGSFHYRSVIGKFNFLEKTTQPDIAYAVHQCARFCEDPKQIHADAVMHLIKYLNGTRDKGIILDPKHDQSFEVYADADFAGNWHKITAPQAIGIRLLLQQIPVQLNQDQAMSYYLLAAQSFGVPSYRLKLH
jgi:hypothetical protein